MPTPLAPGDVHIWYRFTESLDDTAVSVEIAQLSPDEQARCARFVFARDRRDFAAAHALLRHVLSMYDDVGADAWTFVVSATGKPSIANPQTAPPLAFNLSHTHGLVACAVTRGADIGVDVESVDRASGGREIAEHYFSAAEIAGLEACPEAERQTRFVELWTLKEAYLKAIGSGLGHPLDTFSVAIAADGTIAFTPPPDAVPAAWTFALHTPSPRHRLALAARCAHARVVSRELTGSFPSASSIPRIRRRGC